MQPESATILLIEDEPPIRRFLDAALTHAGYRLIQAASGNEGLRIASSHPPDLVILDLGLPDMDGQVVLQRLREWYTGPILVLSAREQEQQKIEALDGGADDYVTKPFGIGELLARMRTAIRHSLRIGPDETSVTIGELTLDRAARQVTYQDRTLHLTPLEYKLLSTLIHHAGKVLTHRFLLREVWGPHDVHENHYLRVFVASLRRKIGDNPAQPRYIFTETGVGYRFASDFVEQALSSKQSMR